MPQSIELFAGAGGMALGLDRHNRNNNNLCIDLSQDQSYLNYADSIHQLCFIVGNGVNIDSPSV